MNDDVKKLKKTTSGCYIFDCADFLCSRRLCLCMVYAVRNGLYECNTDGWFNK